MSSHNREVILSAEAQDDLEDIQLHGLRTWGQAQTNAYEVELDRALEHLARFPHLGRARDEVFPGCRSLVVRQHVVFYSVAAASVTVVRIVHARQPFPSQSDR